MFPPAAARLGFHLVPPAIVSGCTSGPGMQLDSEQRTLITGAGKFERNIWGQGSTLSPSAPQLTRPAVWDAILTETAADLRNLKAGWDGLGSRPVSTRALFRAETLAREVLEGHPLATAPYLVPGGDGSVQIEWHERNGEIELSIGPEGGLYVWGRNHLSGQQFEGEGEKALALFARWAPWLAASSNDEVDVAIPEAAIDIITA